MRRTYSIDDHTDRFLLIFSSKVDRFTSNQDQNNDQRKMLHFCDICLSILLYGCVLQPELNEYVIQGGPAKVRPTYILLVTFGTGMYR